MADTIFKLKNTFIKGEALHILKSFPDESVNCVVTSPPYYGLRDYGVVGQIGLEDTLPLAIFWRAAGVAGWLRPGD